MKHESGKEGQNCKSHLFETGAVSVILFIFFFQHYRIWKTDQNSHDKDEMLDAEQTSLFLASHFNRKRQWINLLLTYG